MLTQHFFHVCVALVHFSKLKHQVLSGLQRHLLVALKIQTIYATFYARKMQDLMQKTALKSIFETQNIYFVPL